MARILIVDDQERLTSIGANLKRAGIEVDSCPCLFSALEQAEENPPDLILCADPLPGLDGLDLLELKREVPSLQEPSVLIVSERRERKLDCFKAGCDDFLEYPCDEAEVFFRICSLLKRTSNRGVRGNFQDISFLDFIQLLVSAHRSGQLQVDFPDHSAMLYFQEGQLFHAKYGDASGEQAFLEALRASQKGGMFNFSSDVPQDIEKTIDKRTDHLLLGLASILDEESM